MKRKLLAALFGVCAAFGMMTAVAAADDTQLTQQPTPNAVFTATGSSTGTLTNVESDMKYEIYVGDSLTETGDIVSNTVDLTGLDACVIKVTKLGDGITTSDSAAQEITVTKANPPADEIIITDCGETNDDGKISGLTNDMEYRYGSDTDYIAVSSSEITVKYGEYHIRRKANGTTLASEEKNVIVKPYKYSIVVKIDDKEMGADDVAEMDDGYWKQTLESTLTITVENIGSEPTGKLNLSFVDLDSKLHQQYQGMFVFKINRVTVNAIQNINPGQSCTFDVRAMPYKSEFNGNIEDAGMGEYTASVKISNENFEKKFGIFYEVKRPFNEAIKVSSSLSSGLLKDGDTLTIPAQEEGYVINNSIMPTVYVTSIGSGKTWDMTATLSGKDAESFNLNTVSFPTLKQSLNLESIGGDSKNNAREFRIVPGESLSPGTYEATVTIKNSIPNQESSINHSFSVKFTVKEAPFSSKNVELTSGESKTNPITIPSAILGYVEEDLESKTPKIFIKNTHPSRSMGPFSITLTGANPDAFVLNKTSIGSIASEATETITVTPALNLALGIYTARLNISSNNPSFNKGYSLTFDVKEGYKISLSQTEAHDFGTVDCNDITLPANLTVTVKSEGIRNTGDLDITLSGEGAAAFEVSPASLSGIDPGKSADFTVKPKIALTEGTHKATVTIGNQKVDPKSFDISMKVTHLPEYIIATRSSGNQMKAAVGYSVGDIEPCTATVSNGGTLDADSLNIALSGENADDFELEKTVISVSKKGSATFKVTPKADLPVGLYTATVTISGTTPQYSDSFTVTFRVKDNYGISLSQTENYTFPDANKGYANPPSLNVAVENVGTNPTGELTIALSGTGADSFDCPSSIASIAADSSGSFIIKPKTGLDLGDYTATVTVSGANVISESFDVSFTVKGTTPASSSGTVHDGVGTVSHEGMLYSPDDDTMTEGVCVAYGDAAYYPLLDVNGDFITDHRLVENLRIKVEYTEGGDLVNGEPHLVKLRVDGQYCYFIKFDIKKELSSEIRDVCGTLTLNKSKKGKVDGKDYRVKNLAVDFSFEVGSSFNYSDSTSFVVDGDLDTPLWANEFFILKYDCGEEVELEFGSDANEGSFTVDVTGQGKNIIAFNTELDENVADANPDAKIIAVNFNEVRFNRSGVFRYEADDMEYAYAIRGGKLVEVGRFEGGEVEFVTNTLGRYLFSDVELVSPESIGDVEFVRESW